MIPSTVRVATGLYCNWDSFVRVDSQVLRWVENLQKVKPQAVVLKSLEEAVYTLQKAFREGGREFLISRELYSSLDSLFKRREKRVGGNGYHMGKVLFDLGLRPLVSYPCRPPNLMRASPAFKIACGKEFKLPEEAVRVGDPEYDHIVFEFTEDPSLGVFLEGRHILSWDRMSSEGKFDYDFLEHASDRRFVDVLILAYAHLLLPDFKKKTDEVVDYLDGSRRPKVHLELGQGSEEALTYALKKFTDYHCVDSLGLNEKECADFLKASSGRPEDLAEAALEAAKLYGVDRVCVHSSSFALSVSKYSLDREAEALTTGRLVAAAKTFGLPFEESLNSAAGLPCSEVKPRKEKRDGYSLCLIPALINRNPKVLTGLGDAFAASQSVKALIP